MNPRIFRARDITTAVSDEKADGSTQRFELRMKQICASLGTEPLADVCAKMGKVRAILINSLPHGTKSLIAEILGLSESRISKQLSGDEALRADVVMVALAVLRGAGMNIAADQVEQEFHGSGRSSLPIQPGQVYRVVEKDGTLFFRSE